MRLASIELNGAEQLVVAVSDQEVVPVGDLVPGITTIADLMRRGDAGLEVLRAALPARNALRRLPIQELRWLPPVPHPSKILNVALNNGAIDQHLYYRPQSPTYFSKPVSSLQSHGGPIQLAPHYGVTHPEAELGVIIGRGGRFIAVADALDHVLGYTIVNDITSVGMRREDRFHARTPLDAPDAEGKMYRDEVLTYPARYKGCDTFCPMGPWVTTRDEIADPGKLDIRCWVDDKLFFEDNLAYYTYSVAEVIFWMSAHLTLQPGDVIAMGTAVNAKNKSVTLTSADLNSSGSVVKVAIEGLGLLENRIERVNLPDPRLPFIRSSP